MTPVYRFAPSPNGALHLGHAYSALLNFELARRTGGRFLVRIEDIDPTRTSRALEDAALADLAWLGIAWEQPVRRQSEHLADYAATLEALRDMGLLYVSFTSRAELAGMIREAESAGTPWPRDPDGAPHADPSERDRPAADVAERIAAGEPYAVRLMMAEAAARAGPLSWTELAPDGERRVSADPLAWGDVVLARKETPTSYHLSVVEDDALQGVTDVVRGEDLYAATAVHRLLQALLHLPEPRYRHHRLIRGPDGRKLSKSQRDTGLAQLRAEGATPTDIRRLIGIDADLAALRV